MGMEKKLKKSELELSLEQLIAAFTKPSCSCRCPVHGEIAQNQQQDIQYPCDTVAPIVFENAQQENLLDQDVESTR